MSVDGGNEPFKGPVFLVGMPRSGTKLLRNLLNQNSRISILEVETEFLPQWISHWDDFGEMSDERHFERFHRQFLKSAYAHYAYASRRPISARAWLQTCGEFTPGGVFEALARHELKLSPTDDVIWGDKSPSYIRHVASLAAEFPTARIVHIIRDVRDYVLSINKAWGKDMLRAAQRWSDDVTHARNAGKALGDRYRELRYEQLLHEPEECLRALCEFLNVTYEEKMLTVPAGTENLGRTIGATRIIADNTQRYETEMSARLLRRIETLAAETLRAAGYRCDFAGAPRRLSTLQLRFAQTLDGINLVRRRAAETNLLEAAHFYGQYFLTSGNRFGERPIRQRE